MKTNYRHLPSVRQCVSSGEHPRNLKRGFKHRGELWPHDIPQAERQAQTTGHRSFRTTFSAPTNFMRVGRKVRVEGHVLIHCVRGEMLIEQADQTILLQSGSSAMLSDTEAQLSELPDRRWTRSGIFDYFVFTDRVLADIVSWHPRAAAIVRLSADYPSPPGFSPFLRSAIDDAKQWAVQDAEVLQGALQIAVNRCHGPLMRLCAERIVNPRTRVQLFLEPLLLQPDRAHQPYLEHWPGGRTALLRHMRHLGLPSAAELIKRRRCELAHTWTEYCGHAMADITRALNVRYPGPFAADYQEWVRQEKPHKFVGINLEDPADCFLVTQPSYLIPAHDEYWYRPQVELAHDEYRRKVKLVESGADWREVDSLTMCPEIRAVIEDPAMDEFVREHTPPRKVAEINQEFLAMKDTGASTAVVAHSINEMVGLHDALDLLKAA